METLSPRIGRLKHRLLNAPYEICMARARYFTQSYRATEGMDPALRNAFALQRTLRNQRIFIATDEFLAGSKTEKTLASPLSVERGDFLRTLQLEMDILSQKQKPFYIAPDDEACFWDEVLPYWNGRTVRDHKAAAWERAGIVVTNPPIIQRVQGWMQGIRFITSMGRDNLDRIMGANKKAPLSLRRMRMLYELRHELAFNNPSPAVYCFDVQGHLCLGVDRVIRFGMNDLIERARAQMNMVQPSSRLSKSKRAFVQSVIISLEAAIEYSERFAALARTKADQASDEVEKRRFYKIAESCQHVPRNPPRTFAEALQSAWMTLLVGEIQFGSMDVFAVGRIDQYLAPFYLTDIKEGRLTRPEAIELLQEYFLKLSANVTPTPELGMESNSVLGNSQHCITIGGLLPDGSDGVNDLTYAIIDAYELMNGSVNQICVRVHSATPQQFLERVCAVFRKTNGLAIYNDETIISGLLKDGMSIEDARNYCIVGCVETCGHSNTQGCVASHDLVLPTVLALTLGNGQVPPAFLGQHAGFKSGDPRDFRTFDHLMEAFWRQLSFQVKLMVTAIAGKDQAHRALLPAPYVSALIEGCIESGSDITAGGARYDFTTIVARGLATLVDSLLAIKEFVYQSKELTLDELIAILNNNFTNHEPLRQRLMREPPKYGSGSAQADSLTLQIMDFLYQESQRYLNIRGGRYRMAYFSVGNHVIDGFFLGATPDGRRRGQPVSNGVSPSNLIPSSDGPMDAMNTVSQFPPHQVSSGVALNARFHPDFIQKDNGLKALVAIISTYFKMGGMHIQPNVVDTHTLRDAQNHPEHYRDLVVKVSGYSACFTDLGRSAQDDIIARCEFGSKR